MARPEGIRRNSGLKLRSNLLGQSGGWWNEQDAGQASRFSILPVQWRTVMIAYIIRRILYAIPILIGVNLLTFALFFVVNTPDDMARMQLGIKRVTPEAIEKWKQQRGYDKPLLVNSAASGARKATETIFFEKSVKLFALDFGRAEDNRD